MVNGWRLCMHSQGCSPHLQGYTAQEQMDTKVQGGEVEEKEAVGSQKSAKEKKGKCSQNRIITPD